MSSIKKMFTLVILVFFRMVQIMYAKNYNVPFAEVSTCKEYFINSDYKYEHLFEVQHLSNQTNQLYRELKLNLKFYVLTSKDAHILLSPTDNPNINDRVYEIIIGAGRNTFSVIGGRLSRNTLVRRNETNVLSPIHLTPIVIQQSIGGVLNVIIEGFDDQPFLTFSDIQPLEINFVGFSTFGKTSAKWFYDCRLNGNNDDQIEIEHKSDNNTQKNLISNLLYEYSSNDAPTILVDVNISLQIQSINFDHHRHEMVSRIDLVITWSDDRLSWNEKEFNHKSVITSSDLKIWKPSLRIVNGFIYKPLNHVLFIYANGTIVTLYQNLEIINWCSDGSSNWPQDKIKSDIYVAYNIDQINLGVTSLSPINGNSNDFHWFLTGISIDFTSINNRSNFQTKTPYNVVFEFLLKRNGAIYRWIFYPPAIFATLIILLSMAFESIIKYTLNGISLLISCIGLIFLIKHVPSDYPPKIVKINEINFWLSTCTSLINVGISLLKNNPPKSTPNWLFAIINFTPFRWLLAVSYIDSAHYLNVQQKPWIELSRLIRRINLTIVFFIFFILIILLIFI